MDIKEIKEKSDHQLLMMIKENSEKLKKLRFSLSSGQLKNYNEINQVKKIIARVKTVLKERSLKKESRI